MEEKTTPTIMGNEEIRRVLNEEFGLTMNAQFVPFSMSRNAKPGGHKNAHDLCINWRVTLSTKEGKSMLVDYQQGIGYFRGYKQSHDTNKILWFNAYHIACEKGMYKDMYRGRDIDLKAIAPLIEDVVYCVVTDSDALYYGSYEDWGVYYEDSRKGEQIYRECIKQGKEFVGLVGYKGLVKLSELFQDY